MTEADGTWTMSPCDYLQFAVCKRLSRPAASVETWVEQPGDPSVQYLVQPHFRAWNDAEEDCLSMGAHLASIHSREEDVFVASLQQAAGISDMYIGLHDQVRASFPTRCCLSIAHKRRAGPAV